MLTISATSTTAGAVKLWKNQNKDDGEFTTKDLKAAPAGQKNTATVTVYVEGFENSIKIDDITLKTKFASGGVDKLAQEKKLTVAPIIRDYKLDLNNGVSLFKDLDGIVVGMIAGKQPTDGAEPGPGAEGLSIRGDLTTGGFLKPNQGQGGQMVQVVNGLDPVAPSHFELADGRKANAKLTQGATFDISDAQTSETTPYVPTYSVAVPEPNPQGRQVFFMLDHPSFLTPPGSSSLKRFTITFRATNYLVWRYADGSLYTLASLKWRTVFAGGLVNNEFAVLPASKTSADGPYVRTHDNPSKVIGPVYNKTMQVVNAP